MNKPLDELYFQWLYSQVGDPSIKNPARTYWRMLRLLFIKEFVWLIPNDDNRIEDGRDLRYEFVDQQGLTNVDPGWMKLGCSMLELLIGLSRRLSFEDEREPSVWFWEMIRNLGLEVYSDDAELPEDKIEDILDQVIWRTYTRTGRGGLFPLRHAYGDQRDIELWYQLSAYVLEKA